jgi:hypothetical protein
VSIVSAMFLGGSTANLPNDLVAAGAAGSPIALTVGLAGVHIALSIALLANALPRALGGCPERVPVAPDATAPA